MAGSTPEAFIRVPRFQAIVGARNAFIVVKLERLALGTEKVPIICKLAAATAKAEEASTDCRRRLNSINSIPNKRRHT